MSISLFNEKKARGEKISMVTCYDFTSARLISFTDIDAILVGDSLAMTMYGHKSTLPATIEMMTLHTAAVARGAGKQFIVADLPFLTFRKNLTDNMNAVEKLMQSGAQAVKLEGVAGNEDFISHVVQSGVPVMGHLGLTPQFINLLGGYKVQGRNTNDADAILEAAKKLEHCGCFSIVLECVPAPLARRITGSLSIPTIGIGAGPDTDGQILVFQDLLGLNKEFKPKFVRTYLNGGDLIQSSLQQYVADVRSQSFPSNEESYE